VVGKLCDDLNKFPSLLSFAITHIIYSSKSDPVPKNSAGLFRDYIGYILEHKKHKVKEKLALI